MDKYKDLKSIAFRVWLTSFFKQLCKRENRQDEKDGMNFITEFGFLLFCLRINFNQFSEVDMLLRSYFIAKLFTAAGNGNIYNIYIPTM